MWLLLGAAAVAVLALGLVPQVRRPVGPATIAAGARVGPPGTVLVVPPLGTISARTHPIPLQIRVTLAELDPVAAADLLRRSPERRAVTRAIEVELRSHALTFAIRAILAGALVGGLALALLPGRRASTILLGVCGGAAGVLLILAATAIWFRIGAFEQPRFTGALERAPQLIEAVQRQAGSLEELRSRFDEAAARLTQVLALVGDPLVDPREEGVAILHVSDIHSNPVGIELTKRLAERFEVAAVLDTGDLTSFGEPVEARVTELISDIAVPYLFVPGNHDSPQVREAMGSLDGVVLLNDRVEDIEGVAVMGWADPVVTARGDVSDEESAALLEEEAAEVAGRVEEEAPDLLAVHNVLLAGPSFGKVPLIVAGHSHREASLMREGTLLLTVGSTGATGLGSFLVEAELAYEAQVIYFREGVPVAYDYVRLRRFGSEFEISRRALVTGGAEEAPAA